jgi:hypothetical protein
MYRRDGEKERKVYKEGRFCYFMSQDKKRKHNFEVEDSVWEEFQVYCIRKKTTATKVISELIKKLVNKK